MITAAEILSDFAFCRDSQRHRRFFKILVVDFSLQGSRRKSSRISSAVMHREEERFGVDFCVTILLTKPSVGSSNQTNTISRFFSIQFRINSSQTGQTSRTHINPGETMLPTIYSNANQAVYQVAETKSKCENEISLVIALDKYMITLLHLLSRYLTDNLGAKLSYFDIGYAMYQFNNLCTSPKSSTYKLYASN